MRKRSAWFVVGLNKVTGTTAEGTLNSSEQQCFLYEAVFVETENVLVSRLIIKISAQGNISEVN